VGDEEDRLHVESLGRSEAGDNRWLAPAAAKASTPTAGWPKTAPMSVRSFVLPCAALLAVACGATSTPPAPSASALTPEEAAQVERLAAAAAESAFAWAWLETLCGDIGHRLSGSPSLERAVAWSAEELAAIEGVTVARQPVEVPVWIRGEESLVLLEGEDETPLAMLGLGGSVGTPPEGLEGELVVLDSMDEIAARGDALRGRIVLLDVPMPPYDEEGVMPGYGAVVANRVRGPAALAAAGARAALVRSLTNDADSPPHTGMTRYDEAGPRIPAAAVSVRVAEELHRRVDAGETVRLRLHMGARTAGTATSHNVIAELPGTDPNGDVVVFGGHIDSWDVGQGCHDDGSGVVSAMATLKLLADAPRVPATLRAVLFTNEENGLGGARAYAAEYGAARRHSYGIESDIGAARVIGLQVQTDDEAAARATLEVLAGIGAALELPVIRPAFSGSDLGPLRDQGTVGVGVLHDPAHYFDLHHTTVDTIEAVDREDFLQGVGVMAATAYVLGRR
jgi:carboxypeptidase Q